MSDNLSLDGTFTGSMHGHRHSGYGYGNQGYGYNNRDENIYRDVSYHTNQVSLAEQLREVGVAVEKTGAANSLATEKVGAAGQLATEKTGAAGQLTSEKVGAANQITMEKIGAAHNVAIEKTTASLGIQAEKVGAATNLAIEKTAAATNLAIEKIGAAAALAAERNAHSIQMTAISGFKDAQLQACVDAAALQKSIADCCCETQKLILSEASRTRDFIQNIDSLNKAVSLVDAKNEILALRASCYPSPCSGNNNGNGNGNSSR